MLEPPTQVESVGGGLDFALKSKKMGCLILAGGQASRLKLEVPKGTLPVTLIKHKSLFQLFFEKAKAVSLRQNDPLPLAIMTSPLNHQATFDFLQKHHFFGFPLSQIFFFQQSMLPLEDLNGNQLEVMGPDGNGAALTKFYESGIWHHWQAMGIECVNVIPVDNILADPFDAKIDFQGEEIIVKAILRTRPEEQVGVLVQKEGVLKVLEYTELPSWVREDKNEEGSLLFSLANSGLYCFSMSFIEKQRSVELPLHRHKKRMKINHIIQDVYKYERFIFDLLPYASNVKILLYPREDSFAPLKNAEGEDSLKKVQEALLHRDRQLIFQMTGVMPDDHILFELDPAFYYPIQNSTNQCRVVLNNSYIEKEVC